MTTTAHRSYWLISVFLLAAGFTWAQPCARPIWTLDKTGPDSVLSVWNTPSIETSFTRVWAMQHPGYRQAPHKLHPVWPGESAAILLQAGLREGRYVAHPCGDSTRMIQEGDIREGKRNGTWTSYWPGGEIFQKIDFGTEDERAAYRDHYLSGRPWSEGELDRLGNRQGTWIQYDTAGRLRLEMAYRDGQPFGWARYLRVDQSPQKRIHFTGYHEKWDTLWTYYPDGQPEICRVGTEIRAAWDSSGTPTVRDGTGVYTGISPGPDYRGLWVVLPLKGGKRHGTVEAFRKTGERYTSALYERDSLRQETRYYPSGPKSMQYNIYTDSTAWQEWYPNGQMKRRTVSTHRDTLRHRLLWYKNGERKEVYDLRFDLEANRWMPDGEWRAWYKNGRPRWERHYLRRVRTGTWRDWDQEGNLVSEKRYAAGRLDGPWMVRNPENGKMQPRTFACGRSNWGSRFICEDHGFEGGVAYTDDLGHCGHCDRMTSSGMFRLCNWSACKLRQCQVCGGPL